MLPRSSDDIGIVVVTETLENLNVSRDYTINRDRVYSALRWLIQNNPLYKDVTIDNFARLEESDIIQVIPPAHPQSNGQINRNNNMRSGYTDFNDLSRIVRASWNQGNSEIFESGYAGVQCFAMALANIVRASILPPSQWNTNILNGNMLAGDEIYATIQALTSMNENAFPIPRDGYLELRNLDVIKNDFIMYEDAFSLDYSDDWLCQGNLNDNMNGGEIGMTLLTAIRYLFSEHNAGILIGKSMSLGLLKHENKYYFTDSHSCGPRGAPLNNSNGKGCIIECDKI